MRWAVEYLDDELPYVVLLRIFPMATMGDTKRGGPSAAREINHRLHLWLDWEWEDLLMEASKRQTKKVAKAEHPKKTTLERTLSRASYYINGGEISKGCRALDGN